MVQFFFFKAILRHFLLSATTDVKDGHGLKLIKLGQLFSISTGMLQAAPPPPQNKIKINKKYTMLTDEICFTCFWYLLRNILVVGKCTK